MTKVLGALRTNRLRIDGPSHKLPNCFLLFSTSAGWATSPNVITYNSAMNSCANSSCWELVLELYGALVSQGLAPTSVTYTAVMSIAPEHWELAMMLFAEMHSRQVSSNTITSNSLIDGLQKGQQWQHALTVFGMLPMSSLRPDSVSFGSAIRAVAAGGNWQLAVFLLAEMPGAKLAQDQFACSSAIQACQQTAQWQAALGLLSDVTKHKVEMDAVICTAAIAALGNAGQWQRALDVLELMHAQTVRRNAISYSAAITACARKGLWQLVFGIVEEMVHHGCRSFSVSKYDHTVQAGSSLDCFKHTVLICLLQAATSDPDSVHFLDTHAGRGVYRIDGLASSDTQNFKFGITKLMQLEAVLPHNTPPAVREYLAAVKTYNGDGTLSWYPGSAALALAWLRPHDTATLFEISKDMSADLRAAVIDNRVCCRREVVCDDSYWWLLHKAVPVGGGLVLIDPPCDPYDLHVAWSLFVVRHLRREQPRSCASVE